MTQSAQYAGKAEELWEKYCIGIWTGTHEENAVTKSDFLASLSEYAKLYGGMVRKEDADVCMDKIDMYSGNTACASYCAAAIKNKELPELP